MTDEIEQIELLRRMRINALRQHGVVVSADQIASALMARAQKARLDDLFADRTPVASRLASSARSTPAKPSNFPPGVAMVESAMPIAYGLIVMQTPSLDTLRKQYEALTPEQRKDELRQYLWASEDPTRPRTPYSDLLDAMGVGR